MGAAERNTRKGGQAARMRWMMGRNSRDGREPGREARFLHMALATLTLRQSSVVQALGDV